MEGGDNVPDLEPGGLVLGKKGKRKERGSKKKKSARDKSWGSYPNGLKTEKKGGTND